CSSPHFSCEMGTEISSFSFVLSTTSSFLVVTTLLCAESVGAGGASPEGTAEAAGADDGALLRSPAYTATRARIRNGTGTSFFHTDITHTCAPWRVKSIAANRRRDRRRAWRQRRQDERLLRR